MTPTKAVVEVDDIVNSAWEPSAHHMTLAQLGPTPFSLLVAKSMLTTRNVSPPVEIPTQHDGLCIPNDLDLYSPPQVLLPNNSETVHSPEENAGDSSDDENVDDGDVDAPGGQVGLKSFYSKYLVSEFNLQVSDEYDDPEINNIIATMELNTVPVMEQPLHSETLHSRILEDAWHVMDRLLRCLKRSHSGYKSVATAFSRALFVYDKDDHAAVSLMLSHKGTTFDAALRKNSDAVHRQICRYIPPPDVLCPVLETLFNSWKDVPCSIDPEQGVLFSAKARNQAENILKSARLGHISDAPGIALYYKMGIDKEGLPFYRCTRGTNSVEGGIHMPLRRTFGSLHASPELSDALLCDFRHRRNTTVCEL